MKKRLLLILTLLLMLLLPSLALAGDGSATRTYVIKKGDTLWGVSQRFIKDPHYWPNLWSNNPFISNPHLIYPGQTVAIYDGRIEIVPEVEQKATEPVATPAEPVTETVAVVAEPLPEPQDEIFIKTMGGFSGFVTLDQIKSSGTLIDATDNRLLMSAGETVFCEMVDLANTTPGDAFSLVEVGVEVRHPVTDEPVGNLVAEVGTLEITGINDTVATARIIDSKREIHRTNLLVPFMPPLIEVALKESSQPAEGVIIASMEGKIGIGQYDIIYIDLGADQGVEPGNLLYISRQRKPSAFIVNKTDVSLPDVLLGAVVVLETTERTSSALVLKAVETLTLGDRVTTISQ
jgi:hypothetical protein